MDENELIEALDKIRNEAMVNPCISPTQAEHKYLLIINHARQLLPFLADRSKMNKLIQITEPYVTNRDKSNDDVYVLCTNVLEIWNEYKK